MGRKPKQKIESFAEEDRRKLLDQLHVPKTSEELLRPIRAKRLPAVIPVGSAVMYKQDYILPIDQLKAGWVIQNPNSPGGQTDSYVVTSNSMLIDVGGVAIIKSIRVRSDQIVHAIDPGDIA